MLKESIENLSVDYPPPSTSSLDPSRLNVPILIGYKNGAEHIKTEVLKLLDSKVKTPDNCDCCPLMCICSDDVTVGTNYCKQARQFLIRDSI